MTEFWALSRAESARRFTQTPAIRSDYRRATSRNEVLLSEGKRSDVRIVLGAPVISNI